MSYRDGISLTWQNGRELASFTNADTSVSYTYDASGMRAGKTVTKDGTTTQFKYVYEGGLLRQMTRGARIYDFSYDANGTPVSMSYRINATTTPTYYYYGTNWRGDVVALYNSSGSITALYEYDAYGNVTVKSTNGQVNTSESHIANINPIRYRGYVYDTETGLYYLQSRYYDPTTCRFVNGDAKYVATGEGLIGNNMFSYCNNNPIMYFDYEGEKAIVLYDRSDYGHIGALIEDDNGTWWHFYYGAQKGTEILALVCNMEPDTWCVEYTGALDIASINSANQYSHTYEDSILLYGDFSMSIQYFKNVDSKYNAFRNNCSDVVLDTLSIVDNYNAGVLREASQISYSPHKTFSYLKSNTLDYSKNSSKNYHILTVKEKRLCEM